MDSEDDLIPEDLEKPSTSSGRKNKSLSDTIDEYRPNSSSKKPEGIKNRLRENPSPAKRFQNVNMNPIVALDRLEVKSCAGKKKSNPSSHLSKESKPKEFNLKFQTRPAETALESYQRSNYSSRLQWVQKPKMVRLRDSGRLENIGSNFATFE
jgi:hypothetical protein